LHCIVLHIVLEWIGCLVLYCIALCSILLHCLVVLNLALQARASRAEERIQQLESELVSARQVRGGVCLWCHVLSDWTLSAAPLQRG